MKSMNAALVQARAASGRTKPRGHAARFECLNLGFGVGTGKEVVSRVELKISALILRHAILPVQAVPTSPLMPNLANIARSGAQKHLHKGLGCQEWLAKHQLGQAPPPGR